MNKAIVAIFNLSFVMFAGPNLTFALGNLLNNNIYRAVGHVLLVLIAIGMYFVSYKVYNELKEQSNVTSEYYTYKSPMELAAILGVVDCDEDQFNELLGNR